MYTVKRLADLAGVTVRTLHHYDQIGLLKPSSFGSNGYRYYDQEALFRLQQILFYRELAMPLDAIKELMDDPDFDALEALDKHRTALQREASRIRRLVRTIDKTVQYMKGRQQMTGKEIFSGFSEHEQAKMAEEAAARWDPNVVHSSNMRWQGYPPGKKQQILDEGNAIYDDLVAAMEEGPAGATVQKVIGRWHAHLDHFWSPSDEQLLGLASLYTDDPRFRERFEIRNPGLAPFLRAAIMEYVQKRAQSPPPAED